MTGGGHPPDPTIAAGPSSLVITTNESVAIFTKAGVKLVEGTLSGMFQSVRMPGEGMADPRVVYDPTSGRFFIAAMGGSFERASQSCAPPGTCFAHFFVAVSRNATPSGFGSADWYLYALDAGGDDTFVDFTRLGVGADIVVLVGTTNRFADDSNVGTRMRVIDKSTIVSGQPATWTDFTNMRDPISGSVIYGLQPALNLTSPGTFFLVNHSTGSNCGLNVWGIEGSPATPKLSVRTAVPSNGRNGCPQSRTLAQQPDGVAGLSLSGVAVTSSPVFFRNGSLWIAQHMETGAVAQQNTVATIRFAEIDVTGWPATVSVKQDVVSQADGTWQFFPAIVVGPANDVAVVFNSSSASEYPSVKFTGRSGSDPPNTLRPALTLKASAVALNSPVFNSNLGNVTRFGDYTGAAIDPEDGSAWLIGEYVKSSTQWATWVGRVELTPELTAAIATHPVNLSVVAGQTARFSVVASGAPPPTYQWQVSTSSGTTWTSLTDAGKYRGTATATLTITGATVGLNANHYRVVATNSVGTATSNAATLGVIGKPMMSLDRTSLVFAATTTGVALSSQTGSQAIRLTQTGAGTVTWTVASTAPWLVVSPTSGSGSATLNVSVQFASGLAPTQTGSITLTFTGAANTAGPIGVTLNTLTTTATTAPQGSFDTPTDGSTGVTGSIAVTGWAVDDVEVTRVRILRDPVAGEPAGALVFIGDAVQVDGARPDVQALFPNLPRSSRAGWGYLALTNFLPGLGNGTFKLTAIADDADGHSTILGTKAITCGNSSATAPFGAIDTPGQGATVSGNVTNFGWVLAPAPRRADPPSGGVVRVAIDGLISSAIPGGWSSRSDLTALFPAASFPGIGNALGVASFDSTALANGVHTISWIVTDNLGAASGIGSRYFTVANGSLYLDPNQSAARASTVISGPAMLTDPRAAALRLSGGAALADAIAQAPGDLATLKGRRGFDLNAPVQPYAFRGGVATIQSEELDRIELHLSETEGHSYAGYLRVGAGVAPLPIGSALNASTGEFTWLPGVGFVGSYELTFVRWAGGRAVARQDVRVVLHAKGSNRVGPLVVIDTPAPQRDVAQPFVVAGHAADLDAQLGTGIETLHVWAYPFAGGEPIFLGVADYGGTRPDVAAVYGSDRFEKTGFGIRVEGLLPGNYDIAVFAWSTVRGGFLTAKTVRLTVQ